jgi:hypothetical protein
MGRIRTVKPEFHTNADLSALPAEAHLLASGLLCYADDEGYFDAHPRLVQAAIFPLRDLATPIEDLMEMLLRCGYITVISHNSKRIGHVVTFTTHQRVNRPTPSRLKPQRQVNDNSVITHAQITEDSLPEGKGKEQGREDATGADHPITPSMVAQGVLAECLLAGPDLLRVVMDVVRAQSKLPGYVPGDIRDAMVTAYREFESGRPRMTEFAPHAKKFFGEGYWSNRSKWPFKDGRAQSSGKELTLLEKVRLQKAAS